MDNDLDPKRIAQIRRELESYATEQLAEIWWRHDLGEWTPEAFAAIQQILAARPAVSLPETEDIVLSGDHLERALQYGEAGRLQDALREVDLAIQQDSGSLEAHQYRGNLLEDLDDLDGAIQSYRKARYLDRSNESTRSDLRRAMTKKFEQVAAKRPPAEEAVDLDEEEPEEPEDDETEEPDDTWEIENDGVEEDENMPGASTEPLSMSMLILIGLGTAWVSIAFIFFDLTVYRQLQSLLAGTANNLLQTASPSDKTILFFSGVLWLGLLGFYNRQMIKNLEINASLYGLIRASFIFLPFISMPIYFYKYFWQRNLDNPG